MEHKIYKVISFETAGMYRLKLLFDDGTSRTIDFQPVLAGPIYGPLLDMNLFSKASIDPEIHTLVWPNGADFDPETLHDWEDNVKDFSAMTHASGLDLSRCAEDGSAYKTGSKRPPP